MATTPSTPITISSNIWSASIRPFLTAGMMDLINQSPTLRSQLNQLGDDIAARNPMGKEIILADTALQYSSQYRSDSNTLFIHPNDLTPLTAGQAGFSANARFVGILAHEIGHRIDDANLDKAAESFGKPGLEYDYANRGIRSEGVSAANSYVIRKEIIQSGENNSGAEIYFPGAQYGSGDDVLKALTRLENSMGSTDAATRFQVYTDVGANYLANVPAGGSNGQTNWFYYLNTSRAAAGLPPAPAPDSNAVALVDEDHDGFFESVNTSPQPGDAGSSTTVGLSPETGVVTGTITDTPDPAGGATRKVATVANGDSVELTQHADAAALANGEQRGDYETTAIEINGAPAENAGLIANVIDATYVSRQNIMARHGVGNKLLSQLGTLA